MFLNIDLLITKQLTRLKYSEGALFIFLKYFHASTTRPETVFVSEEREQMIHGGATDKISMKDSAG